jgi:DNA-binding NtrC family response regulator/PAS domain-containing protein
MPLPLEHVDDGVGDRLEFETMIAELATRFINLPPADLDREIEDALRRISVSLDIDLAILWQFSDHAPGVIRPTHAYVANGLPTPEPMNQSDYPWAHQQVLAGRMFTIESLEDFPPEAAADRATCERLGIKAGACLPLIVTGEPPFGALGLNALTRPMSWSAFLLPRLQLVAAVFANALARRRHELSLLKNEARLSAGSDLAGLAFYEVHHTDGVVWIDDRFRDLVGVPPERELGLQPIEYWAERLHPDDRARVVEERERFLAGVVDHFDVEYRLLVPDERWIRHMARIAAHDGSGNTLKSFGVLRDITKRKQDEEALRRAFVEIQQLKDRVLAESEYLKEEISVVRAHGEITGRSAAIQKVMHRVEQVAPTDSSVLIFGETGTGKELVAQAIHELGPRRRQLMVKVNCAALPSGLVESELFGRERGAFTGALTRQVGRFELADRSTIFLDEVGELPADVQVKLLRVLQEGELERLGSPRTIKVNVRVIAATNRDLAEEVRKGRFRQDLFYRLNVFPIRMPPLRDRSEDIPSLAWTFLQACSSRMGKKITQIQRSTMDALKRYSWPGNVRELRNVIEHGAIITSGDTLKVPLLGEDVVATQESQLLEDVERNHILRVLERTGWHIKGPTGAATALGLNPATLYSRMKKLGIARQL